ARPRTEFAELHAPFTITGGLLKTSDTRLLSPLLRVQAAGKADLVKEDIDLRVEPKLVSSLKGQGDTMDRSGVLIPVLVTGTFSSPKFRPDLQGMLKQTLTRGLPKPEDLLKGQGIGKLKELEEKAKGLLKGFSFGR
ncbi:MAG: AsmA-like C-terminal region-containing protein, partial [Desulfobacterales bacterium]|nr:AsmA-like C-terminal region-containing protein [Desulfobacterales bacterium]